MMTTILASMAILKVTLTKHFLADVLVHQEIPPLILSPTLPFSPHGTPFPPRATPFLLLSEPTQKATHVPMRLEPCPPGFWKSLPLRWQRPGHWHRGLPQSLSENLQATLTDARVTKVCLWYWVIPPTLLPLPCHQKKTSFTRAQ